MLTDGDEVRCHLCGRWMRMVGGQHLLTQHDMTTSEYRELFHLLATTSTASAATGERKRTRIIVDHCRRAVAWVYERVAGFGGDPSRIYVSGNSAGGHLAAVMLVEGWPEAYGLPEDVVKGACAISGVYDLRALVGAPPGGPNDELAMDEEVAARYSPIAHLPSRPRPLIVAVGEPEGGVFRPQAQAFVAAWRAAGLPVTFLELLGQHHFSMGRQLGDPTSELHVATMAMLGVA
ncbi:MAG: alpha/beta hydrolase fold domain-containing protein [Solirubrobacteraceae bacterium]